MAFRDIREFIDELEKRGWLKRITAEVDPYLEISEITDRVGKQGGPALLFENVKGSDMPVLTNTLGSYERLHLALGVNNLDEIGDEIMSFLQLPDVSAASFFDKLKALPKLAQIGNFLPKTVRTGPVKEVIDHDPDLTKIPVLTTWPDDGGPFITLPMVFTKDPVTGKRNVGMYRMQVYDRNTTGMHWHLHKQGAQHMADAKGKSKRMEVAVALGGDPVLSYSATAPLPPGIDEMLLAGFLRKSPVEMVKCETIDIEVPAHAEIVLEGYVDPEELRWEGPFGDHTGYYSLADYYPVFHVTCVTHRKNPIYPATVVGRPPMEDSYLGKATERIFLPLMKLVLPEVVDMNLPWEGGFHNLVVVSIKKKYPGHARKVMCSLWGMGQMMFAKTIVVVDEDVNVQDMSEVWWRLFNNIDPRRDIMFVDGPVDALDHAAPLPHYGSKMGIDGTRKWKSEGHTREWPEVMVMSPEVRERVARRWKEYGLD
ncbi:3-octaprenyl-4-hydroxybenzoate carboxy-lyase, putative [Heliomicrobium modesticaldum Ice1]|uniref:Phenolic acid decarboxylase n=1 Tax=Heliobacterium modesticaldum (strain ATCC 51547 / Ice1) TaxID=498761 RepID=B0TFS3_HELMI|nr:menaquinone biosynthesis decarboxylase [Heliomicrobium modesticaldum]ABZ84503.1 3-octaprenyl-4-hydroxybenzoate carboxy-lyase, putative [Heliomicrobium modesticaldum Ice1]